MICGSYRLKVDVSVFASEHYNEHFGFVKDEECHEKISDCQLLEEDSAPLSYFGSIIHISWVERLFSRPLFVGKQPVSERNKLTLKFQFTLMYTG
jgi:hypothetical protein